MKRKIALIASITISILLIALFSYAAYNKLKIYPVFVSQLKSSPITSGYQNILAWLVPSVEILLAVLLLFPRTRMPGLWGSFFLMLAFTIYVFVLPHFFEQHTCSCGGIISQLSWRGHFYFNLAFTLLAGTALTLFPLAQKQKLAS
jgi:hypothetical protein